MLLEGALDLAELDPETADLYLVVDAAQEVELAVAQVAHAVRLPPGFPHRSCGLLYPNRCGSCDGGPKTFSQYRRVSFLSAFLAEINR
jgi:hypothetical protein